MEEDVIHREKIDLRDDPEILSPPIVLQAYACGTSVTVTSFVPQAEIELDVEGTSTIRTAGYPDPDGFTFTGLTPLQPGKKIRARQHSDGATSDWSVTINVVDSREEYPAGPPRPEISPSPVFECGSRTGVANLLSGCNVWILADGTQVGRVEGAKEHQGVNVNPDYGLNQAVRARAELCGDESPFSIEYNSGPAPNPLPTPLIDDAFDTSKRIRITNLVNGARFQVTRSSGGMSGTYRTWGHAHLVTMDPPASSGDKVVQTMCASNPPSDPGSITVLPCSELPPPVVHPIQTGATTVVVTDWAAGARIKVFQGTEKIGDGGPSAISLTRPIEADVPVYVIQQVGDCISEFARVVNSRCVEPPTSGNPAGLNLFPIGFANFEDGDFKGSVYYPAEDDGQNQPFNERWANIRRSPIVIMAHGNHGTVYDPNNRTNESSENCGGFSPSVHTAILQNHTGYRYLQRQLARMGIIAVSVDCNATNGCTGNSLTNIEQRADLILGSLNHFRDLDGAGDAIFGDRIDFENVGFLGHSRGGEAVIMAANQAQSLDARARAVISLAPVNHNVVLPDGYAFMSMLAANDGDVSTVPGAKFYDLATPAPFKSQVFIDRANHNFFNREWVSDEDGRANSAILSRVQCERILSRYGCALFRTHLLGHDLSDYLTYRLKPGGVETENVHLSFEWEGQAMVDDHEQPGGIGTNTMGEPTAQSSGMFADEFELHQAGSVSPSTFWGNTKGMIVKGRRGSLFQTRLNGSANFSGDEGMFEIWVRVAEVSNGGLNPADGPVFDLGIEDSSEQRAWASSDNVGGIPRPFENPPVTGTKSMMSTLRFPIHCFQPEERQLKLANIEAIYVRIGEDDRPAFALDILQIVKIDN